VHFVPGKNDKTVLLKKSLTENPDGRAIVFLRTKHGAEKLAKHLEQVGYSVASIHGNKSQGQRERALKGFRDGAIKTLIATDVAARGIDIPAVSHVFNYDLPEVAEAYIHRIGRTARAGRDGIAIAFCAPDEARLLRDIEKLMGIDITVASGEAPADMRAAPRAGNRGRSQNQQRGPGGREGGRGEGGRGNGEARRSESRNGGGRPAGQGDRRPRTEGEATETRAGEDRRGRPQHSDRRNQDFRGQRRNEQAPDHGPDNDLVSTSDFRPARKPQQQRPAQTADANGHHRGNKQHVHGRPPRNHGDQQPQGEQRGDGNGGMRRSKNRSGGGQRRERA
jgi:ATP-dependent RNA helicase RhlE